VSASESRTPDPVVPGSTTKGPVSRPVPAASTRAAVPLRSFGEPLLWLTGGALVLCCVMIFCFMSLVLYEGFLTFWPAPVTEVQLHGGAVAMGEVTRDDDYRPDDAAVERLGEAERAAARTAIESAGGEAHRRLVRIGNYELTSEHFQWVSDFEIKSESKPEWAVVFERLSWGRFYGFPHRFEVDGKPVAEGAEASWRKFEENHEQSRSRWRERRELEIHAVGDVNHRMEAERLQLRTAELDHGKDAPQAVALRAKFAATKDALDAEYTGIREKINALETENKRYALIVRTADGKEKALVPADIVRAYPANSLGFGERVSVYLSRWWEFLTDDPREANSEGGVFPAIFGTVVMTMLMSLLVVPFGVLAALYLREYAKAGPLVSAVRIAVNNLAGVPSIVFGVFGLGFFCYIVGANLDELFFEARLPSPTFGTGGVMWAAFTLALLTLPVVIVATEEALAAVPSSMREGSYACGASKWQTIRRIVLPRAMPGIMTGMILAMARGAGEVAPLMLVGAVKLAPELSIDGIFPYLHPERSFMHLGFHIYDLGFQSQNSEAAKPMVFTTTLLLILVITTMNLFAVWLRTRLRRKFVSSQF
jgi:phosphate transport system permease protein